MKQLFERAVIKVCSLLASIAIFLAVSSVSSTCVFMIYQPNLPKELQELQ